MQEVTFNEMPNAIGEILRRMESMENAILRMIDKPDNPQAATAPPEQQADVMTIQEAAKFLKLAVPTVYNKVYARQIPHSKRNNKLYFSREKLTNWLLREEVVREKEPPMTGAIYNAVKQQAERA